MGRRDWLKFVGPVLVVLGGFSLVLAGMAIGVLVERGNSTSPPATLQADEIGNAKDGRELFVSKGCTMCHSFEGQGGSDAPSLDFMKGELTATDVANMSGVIWNHLPTMKAAFEAEQVPLPEFTKNEMASLIAYLHAGGPLPNVNTGSGSMGGE